MTNQSVPPQTPVPQAPSPDLLRSIINEVRLAWRLLLDPRIPLWLKVVPPASLLYLIVPVDFIPDFPFIGLGQLDDIAVLVLGFRTFIGLCPPAIVEEHRLAITGSGAQPPATTGSGNVIDGSFQEVNPPQQGPQPKP